MLKLLLLLISAITLCASCNPSSTTESSRTDSISAVKPAYPNSGESRVAAVEDLAARLADTSGAQLAEIMPFPLPDSIFAIFSEDSAFDAAYAAAGGLMTKSLFLKYFPQISESLELAAFRELFRQIRIGTLLKSDTANGEIRVDKEPCLRFYAIQVSNDTVTISYGSNHNDTYNSAESEDAEVCEWATIWEFRLAARRLHFLRLFQAG